MGVAEMNTIYELNPSYSTTRRVIKEKPVIEKKPDDMFETLLFLPEGEGRQGEGGLRIRGHFKACMPDKPLITVITVVFNGEKFLEETIQSVINQTYDNVEYIIIDGGSTDGTLDIIRQYEHVIDYWVTEKDGGIYDAMNKGILLAMGDWVSFINADDFLWNEQVLNKVTKQLRTVSMDINVAYGQIMMLTFDGEELFAVGEPWDEVKQRFKQSMSIPHQGIMHRRKLFKKHGKFDRSFNIVGDYEFLLRELKTGDAAFIPDIIVAAMRQGGVSSNPKQSLILLWEVRRAQILHGLKLPGNLWLMALARVYIRLILWRILGEKLTRNTLDFGRRMMGLPAYWSKI